MNPINLAVAGMLVPVMAFVSMMGEHPAKSRSKVYLVRSVPADAITIDGMIDDSEWPADGWTSEFAFPWRQRKAPRTAMCCVIDGRRLLFAFQCDDPDLVLRGAVPEDEKMVAAGDRVELFFAKDAELKEYHCLEMSPAGTVLDYRASFYRKFDDSWDCPGLVLAACTRRGGYVVEGSIPSTTLRDLCGADLARGQSITVGAFRAEYSHTRTKAPEEAWISWIHPKAENPDFHIPSALGRFRLQE